MDTRFSARQKQLSMSECEWLLHKSSREVGDLAFVSGVRVVPGERFSVSVAQALSMSILTAGNNHGVELSSMSNWLPPIRTEALLQLGQETSNWDYAGPPAQESQFWTKFYRGSEAIRVEIAPLLKCFGGGAGRQLHYHSQRDVEFLSNSDVASGRSYRAPLFVIDAHKLAESLRSICSGPLFIAECDVVAAC